MPPLDPRVATVDRRQVLRRTARSVATVVLTAALALLGLRATNLGADTLAQVQARIVWGPLVLALFILVVGIVFLALRWRALIVENERVTILPLASALLVGTLLNFALPGPVGEIAAAALVGRRFGIPVTGALAAGLHARFVGLGAAGAAALILVLFADLPVDDGLRRWVYLAAVLIAGGSLGLLGLSVHPGPMRKISAATVGRFRRLASLDAAIQDFALSLASVGALGWRRYVRAAGWAVSGHAFVVLGIWIAATGLGAVPSVAGLAFTYAMATAGAVALVALPGTQLGWDAMFCTLLTTTAGLELPDALVLTVLVRLQQTVIMLLGAVVLVWEDPLGAPGAIEGSPPAG